MRDQSFLRWSELPSVGRLLGAPRLDWRRRVYALVCPETDRVMYVGQTSTTLRDRLRSHIEQPTNRRMAAWLRGLADRGIDPDIRLISLAPERSWRECECQWIAYVRDRANLLNVDADGVCRDSSGRRIEDAAKRPKTHASIASGDHRTGEQWTGPDVPQSRRNNGKRDPWCRPRSSLSERLAQISRRQMEDART